jgi:2-polyprenyl-3-methyl-5-hydroxy-6-metoxy-1,4-benzoquinol methylase
VAIEECQEPSSESGPCVRVESVACNLCGADNGLPLFQGWDRLHDQPGTFQVVGCQECGLIYLNPRPVQSDIVRYYPSDYGPYLAPVRAAQGRVSRWDARYGLYKRLRSIVALQPRAEGALAREGSSARRLLDVGCATGDFLTFARERGWDVHGVELVDVAASFCRDVLDLPVITGDLLAAGYPTGYFDVVTLWNVLEHLYDPAATLLEIRRILRPEGLLVLAAPEVNSLDARIFGPAWVGYDVPRHLYTFSRATLARLLAQNGFRVVRRRCVDSSHSLFSYSVRFWVHGRPGWQWARPWVGRFETSRLVRLLTAPYFRVVDSLIKGPVVTTFARPEQAW